MVRLGECRGQALLTSDNGKTELVSWLRRNDCPKSASALRPIVSAAGRTLFVVRLQDSEARRARRALQGLRRISLSELAAIAVELASVSLRLRMPRLVSRPLEEQLVQLRSGQAAPSNPAGFCCKFGCDRCWSRRFPEDATMPKPTVDKLLEELLSKDRQTELAAYVSNDYLEGFRLCITAALETVRHKQELQARHEAAERGRG